MHTSSQKRMTISLEDQDDKFFNALSVRCDSNPSKTIQRVLGLVRRHKDQIKTIDISKDKSLPYDKFILDNL